MRLHTLLSLALIGSLSSCLSTVNDDQTSQLEQEHQIAEQILVSCEESVEQAEQHFDCESAQSGTIPITHPVEPVEVIVAVPEEVIEAATETEINNLWERVRSQLKFEFEFIILRFGMIFIGFSLT